MGENPPGNPLVSVIVPSFNQGRYIAETLRSCLAQDYRPLEILVMDGASTDETIEEVRRFDAPEVVLRSAPDQGVVDAVNKGFAIAKGSLLTIQSSDDLFLPGAVRAAVAAFRERPSLGAVYGDIEYIDASSRVTGVEIQGPFDLAQYLGRFQYIPQPGTFFTRDALNSARGWRQEVSYCADADFWIRIALERPVMKLDRRVARYRYHPDQRDTRKDRIARDWCRMVDDLLAEERLSPRLRRFARMGAYLARYRYAPTEAWWFRTRMNYRALLSNPMAIGNPRFPRSELLPGRAPIWRWLSRVKRALRLRPPA